MSALTLKHQVTVQACRITPKPSAVQHTSTATLSAGNASDKLPLDSDLPQRPRTTLPPGVSRIERR